MKCFYCKTPISKRDEYLIATHDGEPICDDCYDQLGNCVRCGEQFFIDELKDDMCENCYNETYR